MADSYTVRIAPDALADLREIFNYIRDKSPQNATTTISRILNAIDGLETFPHRFTIPRVGRFWGRQVRSMPVPPFLKRYRINEGTRTVQVLHVRHGARRNP